MKGDLARKKNIPVFWRGKTAKGEKLLQWTLFITTFVITTNSL